MERRFGGIRLRVHLDNFGGKLFTSLYFYVCLETYNRFYRSRVSVVLQLSALSFFCSSS